MWFETLSCSLWRHSNANISKAILQLFPRVRWSFHIFVYIRLGYGEYKKLTLVQLINLRMSAITLTHCGRDITSRPQCVKVMAHRERMSPLSRHEWVLTIRKCLLRRCLMSTRQPENYAWKSQCCISLIQDEMYNVTGIGSSMPNTSAYFCFRCTIMPFVLAQYEIKKCRRYIDKNTFNFPYYFWKHTYIL